MAIRIIRTDGDEVLRKKSRAVDKINDKILELLEKRFKVAREIGVVKAGGSLPVRDPKREKLVIQDRVLKGGARNLSETLIKTVWKAIFKEAYTHQK